MTVLMPALAFELVTAEEMTRRRSRFVQQVDSGHGGPIIIAEGDSWFCYPRDSIWVPDNAPIDVIQQLSNEFAVNGVGKPGDTAQSMSEFFSFVVQDVQYWRADILLLSAGGNDLLGEGRLASYLRDGDRPVAQYFKPAFHALLEVVLSRLERMVRAAREAKPDLKVILHGYDYARPTGKGPWLRDPMAKLGIPPDKRPAIIKSIVDNFYSQLTALVDALDYELAEGRGEIVVLNLRKTVGAEQWYDELHPDTDGFARIRDKYRAMIAKLHPAVA